MKLQPIKKIRIRCRYIKARELKTYALPQWKKKRK